MISAENATKFRGVRPDHGGRLQLKLSQASGTRAEYVLTLLTPEAELSARVSIDASSESLEFGPFQGGSPPTWLEGYAHALLRSALRTKNSEGDWPRRLTRWRPTPKA
ncbi:MAG TPA: hypothetical protein VER12_06135 [Polyangiaceae bacterium]|nr:hypothetical protein [Polyangiaceae bacterium]HYQ30780.1 hypothetical protein [Polyangiaceae bacterium]